MDSILAYLEASWPTWLGIAVAIIPSLITGLTPYPRVDGALTTLLKVLNIFSVLVHRDSPSTLKAPFTYSKPPPGVSVRYGYSSTTHPGFSDLQMIRLLLGLSVVGLATGFLVPSCAAFQGLVQKTISCDSESVAAAIPAILPDVINAIQGGDAWNSQLAALAETQGIELVACALEQAITMLSANSSVSKTPAKVPGSVAIARATAWIATHTK
jgi:hypothetical protein